MKIIVAGAGHGGLTAAAMLSKAGHDVTVYEKKSCGTLGHDWEDRFTFELLLKAADCNTLPENSWRKRGDCAFVSPNYQSRVIINYTEETRQKIMWRKPVINMLIANAEKCGVKIVYDTEIIEPIINGDRVTGLKTSSGDIEAELVIDASGAFSPVRSKLPDSFGIERMPSRGDVFYAYRAYYEKTDGDKLPDVPFEIYLCHAGEQGLSWCNTNTDSVDILIGRIDPLNEEKLNAHIEAFRKTHPYMGEKIINGGSYGVIPVRRPLSLMVANGYAAVGDSAFMTTPMNGMGIDLSLQAGMLLAETVIESGSADAEALWKYNREFHILYGGETAKNEGLKNSLLNLPGKGIDFLFANGVIQSSDLAGAGRNTNLASLLGKFVRGMKDPPYFFAILGGIMKGGKTAKALKKAPKEFGRYTIEEWQKSIHESVVRVTRDD